MPAVDLNADVGESFGRWRLGDDDAVLAAVTSANVACGFHAGDPSTLRRTCAEAATRGVAIGAQVSYRDLAGFGRRFVDVPPDELRDEVLYQLAALDGIARTEGSAVTYVKPHGALYHACTTSDGQASAVIAAASAYPTATGAPLAVLGAPGSLLLERAAAAGLDAVPEGFCDRGYLPDGRLVPRSDPAALVTDTTAVVERAVRMARDGEVVAVDGSVVPLRVRSLCLHGDTPGAAALAVEIRRALLAAGISPAPFTVVPDAAHLGRRP